MTVYFSVYSLSRSALYLLVGCGLWKGCPIYGGVLQADVWGGGTRGGGGVCACDGMGIPAPKILKAKLVAEAGCTLPPEMCYTISNSQERAYRH